MQRIQPLAMFTVIAAVLLVSSTFALITVQKDVTGTGTIKGVGVGIYWDLPCTNETSSLDWGVLEPGSSKSYLLYLRNEGNAVLTLSMISENWNPANSTDYMSVTWNCEGQQVNPDEITQLTITLSVSENVQGIDSFNFNIVILGTG